MKKLQQVFFVASLFIYNACARNFGGNIEDKEGFEPAKKLWDCLSCCCRADNAQGELEEGGGVGLTFESAHDSDNVTVGLTFESAPDNVTVGLTFESAPDDDTVRLTFESSVAFVLEETIFIKRKEFEDTKAEGDFKKLLIKKLEGTYTHSYTLKIINDKISNKCFKFAQECFNNN